MPGKHLRKEIKGFWFQYLDILRVWLISLSISIDICYLNLLSLCFPIIFHSTSSPESLRVLKKMKNHCSYLVNISFQHVLIGKTAGEMDSL